MLKKRNKSKQQPKPKLDFEIPVEDHKYLAEKLKGFRARQTESGMLDKETMVKLLKSIGQFAKNKNIDMANKAQNSRLEHYGKDDTLYVDTIRHTVRKEEINYDRCTKTILHKLHIPEEVFIQSEQALFSDPFSQVELIRDNHHDDDLSEIQLPESLDKETTVEIVRKANDVAFSKYKELHYDIIKTDPSLTPIVITCLCHDYILDVYGYDEQTFKAAIQQFNAFDDPELSVYIQKKQMELMQI